MALSETISNSDSVTSRTSRYSTAPTVYLPAWLGTTIEETEEEEANALELAAVEFWARDGTKEE